MKSDKSAVIVVIVSAVLITAAAVSSLFVKEVSEDIPYSYKEHLKVMMDMDHAENRTSTLVVGYNYHLLREYASFTGRGMDIAYAKRKTEYIDSLKSGVYDILVLPREAEFDRDSLIVSDMVDSTGYWIMCKGDEPEMESVNAWLKTYMISDYREEVRPLFMRRFNPYRSRARERLSPYDETIRLYADSLGWDWRQLAAIIYKESRFHIEARSYRGAAGLMQMMPRTARHYGLEDPLNPEESIAAGYRLLNSMDKRYIKLAPIEQERFKIVLAAYNAGIGRVADMISLARSMDIETSCWDSLKTVIPYMNNPETLDTSVVKLGVFKGTETLNYVDGVNEIYLEFCRICK